jgi:putative ABC transport system ATP-binding protein
MNESETRPQNPSRTASVVAEDAEARDARAGLLGHAPPDPHAEPTEAALLDLSGVSKDYVSGAGIVRALREVDLRIAKGEFVAIVGTSGSGKSTLMNILGCLDRPTRGTYKLAGFDVGSKENDARALIRNRLIGFIFQGFNLLPRTTALENVELPLQYRGIAAAERARRAKGALAAVGLGDRIDHTPSQLSGGQQQRVAIARALVTDPPLLLADEPTGNLDTRTSYEVLALLQRLNRDRGITIVLVTHERDIAACASRIITVRDGRIVSDGPPDERVDAERELHALPPPNDGAHKGDSGPLDPEEERRRRLGGAVPIAVDFAMAFGAILGLASGLLYERFVLGTSTRWIVIATTLLGEAVIGARAGRKRVGHPLTLDQRGRLALRYTLVTSALIALLFTLGVLPRFFALSHEALAPIVVGPWFASIGRAFALLLLLVGVRMVGLTLARPRR